MVEAPSSPLLAARFYFLVTLSAQKVGPLGLAQFSLGWYMFMLLAGPAFENPNLI